MNSRRRPSDNPNTAIEYEKTKSEADASAKVTERRRSKEVFVPNFNIPGVQKVALSEETQEEIKCLAGQDVTFDRPWKLVEKVYVEDAPEFSKLKAQISSYPASKVLLVYVPDEQKEIDEFLVCLTEAATEAVKSVLEKLSKFRLRNGTNSIFRKPGPWSSKGSEEDVDSGIQKNRRNLLEVEMETRYPILPFKTKLRATRVQDIRDGYMALQCNGEVSILKSLLDTSVQVTPAVRSSEAQTVCTYPKNFATQYCSDSAVMEEVEFGDKDIPVRPDESFFSMLEVNGCMNFYLNDYEYLKLDPRKAEDHEVPLPSEFTSFINMDICGKKKIADVDFHPTIEGVVAISYVDTAPASYVQPRPLEDEVRETVYGLNPILLWSFTDNLNPRQALEAPRAIHVLSFCPSDPSLLLGGCSNGQIVIWNLPEELVNFKADKIQNRHSRHIRKLVNWEVGCDLVRIRPNVVSKMKSSHKGCVSSAAWLPYRLSKLGRVEEPLEGREEEEKQQLQVFSSGEDGNLIIWELSEKSLTLVYRIVVNYSISSSVLPPLKTRTIKVELEEAKQIKTSEFFAGTLTGDFLRGSWDGQEFDPLESPPDFEEAKILSFGMVHDGPITGLAYSAETKAALTVGGKVFALWKEDLRGFPALWRKGMAVYTNGSFDGAGITLSRVDGVIESWVLHKKSYEPVFTHFVSNIAVNSHEALYEGSTQEGIQKLFGFSDHHGNFRLFHAPKLGPTQSETQKMNNFLEQQIIKKTSFQAWQQLMATPTEPQPKIKKIGSLLKKVKWPKSGTPTPTPKVDWESRERMKSVMVKKKQLDLEALLKQRGPLVEVQKEEEDKRRKQSATLKESRKIFRESVGVLFPDYVKERPVAPVDPYETRASPEDVRKQFDCYEAVSRKAKDFLDSYSFQYEFDWCQALKRGSERRRNLDSTHEVVLGRRRRCKDAV